MFAFHSKYLAPIEEVDKYLDAHRAFIKTRIGKNLVCSGPKVPRNGGFIMLNAANRAEAELIMADDPYVINGIAKYEMIEFDLKSCVEGFRELLK